jgi:hypothetical protein
VGVAAGERPEIAGGGGGQRGTWWAARLLSALLEGVERRLREQEFSRMVVGGDSTSRGSSGPSSYSSSDSRSWSAMGRKLVTGDRPDSAMILIIRGIARM